MGTITNSKSSAIQGRYSGLLAGHPFLQIEELLDNLLQERVDLENELYFIQGVNDSRRKIETVYAEMNRNSDIYYLKTMNF